MLEPVANDSLGLVGALLERKYRIDARVAEGGFGVVHGGQHIGLATPLALIASASSSTFSELEKSTVRLVALRSSPPRSGRSRGPPRSPPVLDRASAAPVASAL